VLVAMVCSFRCDATLIGQTSAGSP